MPRTKALLAGSVLASLVVVGVVAFRFQQNRSYTCTYEAKKWLDNGLPSIDASNQVFRASLVREEGKARSDAWAGELLCAGLYDEAGRVLDFYLSGPNRNATYLALVSSEFAFREKRNGPKSQAKHFRALFETPALRSTFFADDVQDVARTLGNGNFSFRQALFKLIGPKLANNEERTILRTL